MKREEMIAHNQSVNPQQVSLFGSNESNKHKSFYRWAAHSTLDKYMVTTRESTMRWTPKSYMMTTEPNWTQASKHNSARTQNQKGQTQPPKTQSSTTTPPLALKAQANAKMVYHKRPAKVSTLKVKGVRGSTHLPVIADQTVPNTNQASDE